MNRTEQCDMALPSSGIIMTKYTPRLIAYFGFALGFACLVCITTVYRPAWSDEGEYLDAGANLALGRGFVSTCWDSCSPGSTWGSATPGFPLISYLLFSLFGFGITVARLAFFSAHLLGSLLIIRWSDRSFGLSAEAKLVFLVVLMGAPALSYHAIYNARLECVALLLCACFLFLRDGWEKGGAPIISALIAFGFISLMLGLHFSLFFALTSGGLFLFKPSWAKLRFSLTLACGIFLGILVLRLAYGQLGVWDQFVAHRSAHFGRELPWVPTGIQRFYVTKDLGIFAIGCATLLTWDLLTRLDDGWKERVCVTGSLIALTFAIPLTVGTVGIWHAGYAWMLGLPMVLGTGFLFRKPPTWPLCGLAALGLLLGIAGAAREIRKIPGGLRDDEIRAQAVRDLTEQVKAGEGIASTFDFYYELRPEEPMVFFRCEHESRLNLGFKRELYFPDWAQSQTRWLLACEAEAPAYLEGIGGSWSEFRRYDRDHPKGDYVLLKRLAPPGK
jgi:hypothetical protein